LEIFASISMELNFLRIIRLGLVKRRWAIAESKWWQIGMLLILGVSVTTSDSTLGLG